MFKNDRKRGNQLIFKILKQWYLRLSRDEKNAFFVPLCPLSSLPSTTYRETSMALCIGHAEPESLPHHGFEF